MTESNQERFWERIPLHEMNEQQWESICDGCCQCCANKLEDEDSGEIFKTNVVCRYLDSNACQCTVYTDRQVYVPACIKVTAENAGQLSWMPESCGYRRLAEGKPLPEWHPLITGDPDSTRKSGHAVTNKVISEAHVNEDDLENFIVSNDYFIPIDGP